MVTRTPPTPTAPRPDHVLYDGRTGRPTTLDVFVRNARGTDVLVFGELHDHPVGARYQIDLLRRLGREDRPVALAMEFFEADQQEDVDAYLAGTIDEATFRERTRRSPSYAETHGPLVLWAKENGMPVIAANAPRRLVSGFRKFEGDYDAYRASLTEAERAWLPAQTTAPKDEYWERFAATMGGGEKAEAFFRAQALWDDAMAGRIASFRDAHPAHRVLFVVGAFHVTGNLGTLTKLRALRPGDKVALLTMDMDDDAALPFDATDRGAGDVVLKVKPVPAKAPSGSNPHERPKPQGGTDAPVKEPPPQA